MRKSFFEPAFLALLLLALPRATGEQARPVPPGVREADKQINAPVEPPVKFSQKATDAAKLRQEAEELARLSAAIPAQVDQVAHDQIPKELGNQLKRIEKLAKQLRSQLTP